jgi:hypothetical protein
MDVIKSFWKCLFLSLYFISFLSHLSAQPNITIENKFSFGIVNWLLKPRFRQGNHPNWYTELTLDINLSYTGRDDNAGFFGGFRDS